MLNRSAICCFLLGVAIVATFPIEIKDIQYLFPPQNTLLDAASQTYHTEIDKQVGDSEEERKASKACIPKLNASPSAESADSADSADGSEVTTDGTIESFEDNTPLNGTIVDDPMEVKIYKPECDD